MPQMKPMLWIFINLWILMMLTLMITKMYYMFNKLLLIKLTFKKKYINFNFNQWKW